MTPTDTVLALLFFVFIVAPLAYWAVALAWWAFRMVFFGVILLVSILGAAWRGEYRNAPF